MHKREVASLQAEILLRLRAVLRAWRDLRGQELGLCWKRMIEPALSLGAVLAGATASS